MGTPSGAGVRPGGTPAASPGGVLSVGPFAGHKLIISCHVLVKDERGSYRVDYCFALRKGDEVQPLYSDDWPDELARVDAVSGCHAIVQYQGKPVDVYCDPEGDALRRKYNAALFAGGGVKTNQVMTGHSFHHVHFAASTLHFWYSPGSFDAEINYGVLND